MSSTPACAGRAVSTCVQHPAGHPLVLAGATQHHLTRRQRTCLCWEGATLDGLAKRQHQALQGQLQHVDVILLVPHYVTQHRETLRPQSRLGLQRGGGNAVCCRKLVQIVLQTGKEEAIATASSQARWRLMVAAWCSDLRHICQQVTQGCQAFPPVIREKPICNALQQAINLLVNGGSCTAALHFIATNRERGLQSIWDCEAMSRIQRMLSCPPSEGCPAITLPTFASLVSMSWRSRPDLMYPDPHMQHYCRSFSV